MTNLNIDRSRCWQKFGCQTNITCIIWRAEKRVYARIKIVGNWNTRSCFGIKCCLQFEKNSNLIWEAYIYQQANTFGSWSRRQN